MQRGGYKLGRGRRAFRCRLHVLRPRVRVLCVLERMKRVCNKLLVSVSLAGKSTLKSLMYSKKSECVCRPDPALRPQSYGRSNSFYAEAIADCLEFIKRSSSPVDSRPVNVC